MIEKVVYRQHKGDGLRERWNESTEWGSAHRTEYTESWGTPQEEIREEEKEKEFLHLKRNNRDDQ